MKAYELFQAGCLVEAIQVHTEEVRAHPTDLDARYFLFVLLCFAGELERASNALNVIAQQESKLEKSSLVFRSLLAAEDERRRVWREEGEPLFPADPPVHVRARAQALASFRRGDLELADKTLREAEAPSLPGILNGEPFDAIRDYDDLLGSVLEAFVGGRYLWVPLERIRKLTLSAPSTSIDLLWIRAELEDMEGATASVYVPALYEGSYASSNEKIRLGQMTDWVDQGGLFRGSGQRILLTARAGSENEAAILSVNTIEFPEAT